MANINQLFEEAERQKSKEFKKKQRKENKTTAYMWAAFGLALAGGIGGGILFFTLRWLTSVFSVLFFLLNGFGALLFYYEFIKYENHRKLHALPVILGDVLSVFVTLTAIYLLIPDYVQDRVAMEYTAFDALRIYLFGGMLNKQIWIFGIVVSLLGMLVLWIILHALRKRVRNQ